MAKARLSFTIGSADAERLRAAARARGVAVSAYVEDAVLERLRRDEAVRAIFAQADAASAAAFEAVDAAFRPNAEPLDPARKSELDNVLDAVLGQG